MVLVAVFVAAAPASAQYGPFPPGPPPSIPPVIPPGPPFPVPPSIPPVTQPGRPSFITSTPTPAPGSTFTVSGQGCVPFATVDIRLNGTTVTVTADSSGAFSSQLTAPTRPGRYVVTATCGTLVQSLEITVPAAAGVALPTTGSDALGAVQLAIVLMAAGGIALVGVRQRRPVRVRSGR